MERHWDLRGKGSRDPHLIRDLLLILGADHTGHGGGGTRRELGGERKRAVLAALHFKFTESYKDVAKNPRQIFGDGDGTWKKRRPTLIRNREREFHVAEPRYARALARTFPHYY